MPPVLHRHTLLQKDTVMDLALKTGVVLDLVGLSQLIDTMSQRLALTGIPFSVMA